MNAQIVGFQVAIVLMGVAVCGTPVRGAIQFVDSGQRIGAGGNSLDVALGDVDGDGDLDAVVASYGGGGRSQVWINQGRMQGGAAGTFADSGQQLGDGFARSVALADLDGDGDLDILLVEGSFQALGASYEVWVNQGGKQGGSAGVFRLIDARIPEGIGYAVALGQLDGKDGLDAFFAGSTFLESRDEVWLGDGAGGFKPTEQLFGDAHGVDVALGDLDGDGDLDAVVGHLEGDSIWINDGIAQGGSPGFFREGQTFGGSYPTTQGVVLGDFDGDGDLDIFLGKSHEEKQGALWLNEVWINQGGRQGGTAGKFKNVAQPVGTVDGRKAAVGDLDGDGDLDVFVPSGLRSMVYENDGSGQFSDSGIFLTQAGNAAGLGDLDGDGDLDAFIVTSGVPNRVWFNVTRTYPTAPNYLISTVAGNGTRGTNGNGGQAIDAELNGAIDVAVDRQRNIFILEYSESPSWSRVRKVGRDGVISTYAGIGPGGYSGDGGPAEQAQFLRAQGMAVDYRGNLYIADTDNDVIRRVDTNGIVSTFAGNRSSFSLGDGGPAVLAELAIPKAVAVDPAGNVYIADSFHHRIRKVDTNGIITTVAGDGSFLTGREDVTGPALDATLDTFVDVLGFGAAGEFYLSDSVNNRMRKVDRNGIISTVVRSSAGFAGDGGPVSLAEINNPTGLAVDARGNLFIADTQNSRIRRVDTNGMIATIAGDPFHGTTNENVAALQADLSGPGGLAFDAAGTLYVAIWGENRVRKLTPTGSSTPIFPNLVATPAPATEFSFGSLKTGVVTKASRPIVIQNSGLADLQISSISFVPPGTEFTISGMPRSFPYLIRHGISDDVLELNISCLIDAPGLVQRTLHIVTNDPDTPEVNYVVNVEAAPEGVYERLLFVLAGGSPLPLAARMRTSAAPGQPGIPSNARVATLFPDTNSPMSLTAEIPSFLGGGAVQISNFTGSVTVSLATMTEDPTRALLRVERGQFTAPSIRLPNGIETGPNTLTFGPAHQSGGILRLTNGSYTAYASAVIKNTLFPGGIPVRGNYSGTYNAATGRATVESESVDTVKPPEMLRVVRSGDTLSISWLATGVLESAAELFGPWTPLSNAVSPFPLNTSGAREFFRLRQTRP